MIIIIINDDLVLCDALRGVNWDLSNYIGSDVTEYVKRVKQPGKYFLVPCSNGLSLCHATLNA